MAKAGGWQKVLRSSTKEKVQRPGRYSFQKREFRPSRIPNESWGLQLSKSGSNAESAEADLNQGYDRTVTSARPLYHSSLINGPIYRSLTGRQLIYLIFNWDWAMIPAGLPALGRPV